MITRDFPIFFCLILPTFVPILLFWKLDRLFFKAFCNKRYSKAKKAPTENDRSLP